MKNKIVWISRSTGPNNNHKAYIESLKSDIYYIDWPESSSSIHRLLSWIKSAWKFRDQKKYNVIITIDIKIPIVIAKILKLIRKDQKIVCFHATELLYFLKSNFYSKVTEKFFIKSLNCYDAHICISKMGTLLLEDIIGKNKIIHTMFNGVTKRRQAIFKQINPNLNSNNIIFISNLYAGWRLWYKGIDLMLNAFEIAIKQNPNLTLSIVGFIDNNIKDSIFEGYSDSLKEKTKLIGSLSSLEQVFLQASLCIHCSRGEAFGNSIVEAMWAGVPTIVSEYTGSKEVVELSNEDLIFPLNPHKISEKINWYFDLTLIEKQKISDKMRTSSTNYTQENAMGRLKEIVDEI